MQIIPVLILLLLIGTTLWWSEKMAGTGKLSLVLARKLVHLVAVGSLALSPLFFDEPLYLQGIVLGFTALLFWAVATRRLAIDEQRHRKSWGIALFPLSFLFLYSAFYQFFPWLVLYPMLVLALADPAAALAGELLARRYWQLTGDRKSWIGSTTFFLVAAVVLLLLPGWLKHLHPALAWPYVSLHHWPTVIAIIVVAAVAALAEALGSGGSDNVTVPLMVAWGLAAVGDSALQAELVPALLLSLLFAVLAWWRGWLDAGGAALASLIGILIWTAGGWTLALPLLIFFVSGSLLGRLPRINTTDAKHGRARDWMQVLANGGIAALFMWLHTFLPQGTWVLAAWVSVAISMADTWSSEIGQWAGGKVVNIIGFKPMQAGLSGGVSWQGTLGGLAGALVIGWLGYAVAGFDWLTTGIVTLAGFAGMLADSLLGSVCQASYARADGLLTENREEAKEVNPVKGWAWMTNDWVNLLSNAIVCLLALLLVSLTS
jgi:uncharacterized protein (TIGR00297 family)